MAKVKRSLMSPSERQVWAAAYGAAFVAYFEAFSRSGGFDNGAAHTTAECPGLIADHAVCELRRWRKQENKHLGHMLEVE
jgi:hypothetical protein